MRSQTLDILTSSQVLLLCLIFHEKSDIGHLDKFPSFAVMSDVLWEVRYWTSRQVPKFCCYVWYFMRSQTLDISTSSQVLLLCLIFHEKSDIGHLDKFPSFAVMSNISWEVRHWTSRQVPKFCCYVWYFMRSQTLDISGGRDQLTGDRYW